MTRALVTGANGHIGSHLVRELLERNQDVVPFVRRSADLTSLSGLGVEPVYGDVTDVESLKRAAQDCDVIFHLATVYKTWAKDPNEIIEPAIEGTINICEAARAAGVKRLIYTSSIVSVGYSDSPTKARTETDWNTGPINPYSIAKTQSEREVHRLASEYGIEIIVICPAMVLGAGDYKITPSNKFIADLLNGYVGTYRGGLNIVGVRDVARAHAESATKGVAGERYIVGGENLTGRQLQQVIHEACGRRPLYLPFPRWVSIFSAMMMEWIAKLLGITPLLTRSAAEEAVDRYAFFDCSKAREAFGFEPTPAKDVIAETAAWLAHRKSLRSSVASTIQRRLPPQEEWID